MATQSRGAPYPLGTDANNTAADIQALSLWVNDRPGVAALTTTQRNALTGADRWDGKLVLDTTLDRLYRWDAGTSTWIQLPDTADIAALLATTGLPAALGTTASRGVSSSAARADHVHPGPTFQTWSPTIAGGGALGNGTSTGRYTRFGNVVHYWARITAGTTTTQTGIYVLNLPIQGDTTNEFVAHHGEFYDASTVQTYHALVRGVGGGTAVSLYVETANGQITGGAYPFAPIAAGDQIAWRGTYEAA